MFLIDDATAAITETGGAQALKEMEQNGVRRVTCDEVVAAIPKVQ